MEELISLGRLLWDNGEPGFFEINTHKILSKKFKDLGFLRTLLLLPSRQKNI